jgi:hypothetical protein
MGRASSSNGDRSPTPSPTPMMETWVLIPPELSLVLQPPSQQARVWTRVPVTQGRRWSPFQGTVRLGVMPSTAASDSDTEVRHFEFSKRDNPIKEKEKQVHTKVYFVSISSIEIVNDFLFFTSFIVL